MPLSPPCCHGIALNARRAWEDAYLMCAVFKDGFFTALYYVSLLFTTFHSSLLRFTARSSLMFCSVMFGALAVFFIFTTTPPTTEVPKASSDILLGLNLVTLVTLGGLVFVGLGLARPM
jgi:hypothetical protein